MVQVREKLGLGHDDAHGPARGGHGRVGEPGGLAEEEIRQPGEAFAAARHGLAHGAKLGAVRLFGQGEDALAHDVAALGVGDEHAVFAEQERVARVVHVDLAHLIAQPFQGDVGRDHAAKRPFRPFRAVDGHAVGGHDDVAAGFVEIGFAPDRAAEFARHEVPVLQFVAVLVPQRHLGRPAVPAAEVGGVALRARGEGACGKGRGRAEDVGVAGQEVFQVAVQAGGARHLLADLAGEVARDALHPGQGDFQARRRRPDEVHGVFAHAGEQHALGRVVGIGPGPDEDGGGAGQNEKGELEAEAPAGAVFTGHRHRSPRKRECA